MNKREKLIINYLNDIFPDALSNLISEYVYYLYGESHIIIGKSNFNMILCVSILSDGRIISGSSDRTLTIWKPQKYSTNIICTDHIELVGHVDWVSCITIISLDRFNEKIVSGSHDTTIKIWDSKTGKCDATLIGHSDYVRCVAILCDHRIVSGSDDRTLKIWDSTTNICNMTLIGHSSWVWMVSVFFCNQSQSINNERILSGSLGEIKIWNPTTGTCDIALGDNIFSQYRPIHFNQNLIFLNHSSTNGLKVFDIQNENYNLNLIGHKHLVSCCAILPDGRIISGSIDKTLKIWNKSGELEQTFTGHADLISCIAIFPDGKIISGSHDGTIRIWT